MKKALTFLLICVICIGVVTAIVLFSQWLTDSPESSPTGRSTESIEEQ
ncbi:MAG: hypothetical protein H7A21_13955 [Spirochaetales bacterium]|nr:hypothetical protein [Leptospiraceae bacterium]MCP5482536.1 hypothetical protein [Spirochaetales bacterium]MCP5485126.1 hypothetical protein [Spirochaetales bacterium]